MGRDLIPRSRRLRSIAAQYLRTAIASAFIAASPTLVRAMLEVVKAAKDVRMLDWTTDEAVFQRLHQALSAFAEAVGPLDRSERGRIT